MMESLEELRRGTSEESKLDEECDEFAIGKP